jgi:hypothetical protein
VVAGSGECAHWVKRRDTAEISYLRDKTKAQQDSVICSRSPIKARWITRQNQRQIEGRSLALRSMKVGSSPSVT